jgi:hypothetical protein
MADKASLVADVRAKIRDLDAYIKNLMSTPEGQEVIKKLWGRLGGIDDPVSGPESFTVNPATEDMKGGAKDVLNRKDCVDDSIKYYGSYLANMKKDADPTHGPVLFQKLDALVKTLGQLAQAF